MKTKLLVPVFFLLTLTLVQAQQKYPKDFQVTYNWSNGSLPPQYQYVYNIAINPVDSCTFELRGHNENDSLWIRKFAVSKEDIAKLYKMMLKINYFKRKWSYSKIMLCGAKVEGMEARANKKSVKIEGQLEQKDYDKISGVYSFIKSLVPKDIWDEFEKVVGS